MYWTKLISEISYLYIYHWCFQQIEALDCMMSANELVTQRRRSWRVYKDATKARILAKGFLSLGNLTRNQDRGDFFYIRIGRKQSLYKTLHQTTDVISVEQTSSSRDFKRKTWSVTPPSFLKGRPIYDDSGLRRSLEGRIYKKRAIG